MANEGKSKGKKPKVAKAKKDPKAAELVLSLGVEGGGVRIYRTSLASGGWQFHEEGGSMWKLDDDDGGLEEVWDHSTSKPFKTIQEALRSIAKDGSWVLWYPISIHPDYRYIVWELVQEIIGTFSDDQKRRWEERSGSEWKDLCLRKVKREPLPKPTKKAKKKAPEPGLFGPFDTEAE